MEIDIIIDSLMNCLVNTKTGEECDTEYRNVTRTISIQDAEELKAGSLTGAFHIKKGMKYTNYY